MHKFMRNCLTASVLAIGLAACGDDVTVTQPPAPPAVPNITSFSVAPAAVTLVPGQTVQTSYNLQLAPSLTGTVAYVSSATTVATISGSGLITAVAPGSTVITATATSGGQTSVATIGVTVNPVSPASISIASVTQGLLTLPVNLSNVNGQIEINVNFNPGGQLIDSVVSYIGSKRAAVQAFSVNAIPAAGTISMSVNTANFRKNFNQAGVATTGATQVDFLNGPTTINAIVYPKATTGQSAGNCTNAPPGVPAVCSSNTFSIIMNNMDSWAADMTKPTATATSAALLTYWGGPTAAGNVSATLYPVVYTPGRSVTNVTWTIGGCSTINQTALPFTRTFGYTAAPASAATACGYEWTGGIRDNVLVAAAIDNGANPYAFAGLIPNTVVFNSTPDSIRLDYLAPSVNTPSITRTAPAVTGWVNAAFNFINFSSTDAGVGIRATRDRAVTYNVVNCPAAGAQNVAMGTGTGADIPECATNFIGGTPGLGFPGTAPYEVQGTESDRLANVGTSSPTSTFGVDKTVPSIRWGLADLTVPAYTAPLGVVVAVDSQFRAAKPVTNVNPDLSNDVYRVEYLDDRAGFFNAGAPSGGTAAQRHALSYAGHTNPLGLCVVAAVGAAPGATFVTAPTCTQTPITAGGFLRVDGWQGGQQVNMPAGEGYYGYASSVIDAAGNASVTLFRKAIVNTVSPFITGLAVPGTITAAGFNIGPTFADSAEIIAASLQLEYPNLLGVGAGGTLDSVRYTRVSVGTKFDDVITSPFVGLLNPTTGAPYVRHMEVVDATVFPGLNVQAAPVNNKPTTVVGWSWNVGSTLSGGPLPGRSLTIPLPALNVQDGITFNTFNTGNVTNSLQHFRVIPTVATTNQFGSIVPLRAQAVSPTNTPNSPFVRVDFYRWNGVSHWDYLGSSTTAIGSDQGTYRSWVYQLAAPYATRWDGVAQASAVAATNVVAAVGVTAAGDGIVAGVTMTP
ncbi:MAG: Ig-like domain-containing protein [Gemmatimonadetes bacterium]|nr:Ig-like domain-containing protein [Gemmatimonadota bacterium]